MDAADNFDGSLHAAAIQSIKRESKEEGKENQEAVVIASEAYPDFTGLS